MKKANMAFWGIFLSLIIIFAIAFTYFVMTVPIQGIHDKVEADIDPAHQPTFDKIKTGWDKWPIVGIFMAVVMGFVWVIKSKGPSDLPPPYY